MSVHTILGNKKTRGAVIFALAGLFALVATAIFLGIVIPIEILRGGYVWLFINIAAIVPGGIAVIVVLTKKLYVRLSEKSVA